MWIGFVFGLVIAGSAGGSEDPLGEARLEVTLVPTQGEGNGNSEKRVSLGALNAEQVNVVQNFSAQDLGNVARLINQSGPVNPQEALTTVALGDFGFAPIFVESPQPATAYGALYELTLYEGPINLRRFPLTADQYKYLLDLSPEYRLEVVMLIAYYETQNGPESAVSSAIRDFRTWASTEEARSEPPAEPTFDGVAENEILSEGERFAEFELVRYKIGPVQGYGLRTMINNQPYLFLSGGRTGLGVIEKDGSWYTESSVPIEITDVLPDRSSISVGSPGGIPDQKTIEAWKRSAEARIRETLKNAQNAETRLRQLEGRGKAKK